MCACVRACLRACVNSRVTILTKSLRYRAITASAAADTAAAAEGSAVATTSVRVDGNDISNRVLLSEIETMLVGKILMDRDHIGVSRHRRQSLAEPGDRGGRGEPEMTRRACLCLPPEVSRAWFHPNFAPCAAMLLVAIVGILVRFMAAEGEDWIIAFRFIRLSASTCVLLLPFLQFRNRHCGMLMTLFYIASAHLILKIATHFTG
jgi:hypothetical protein